jgi:hypothetical protein
MLLPVVTSSFYEVRCERCRTSFAPETKRCIHCGGPLGRGIGTLLRPAAAQSEPAGEPGDEEEVLQVPGRSLLWIVTAVLALGVSLLRACMER